MLHEQLASLRTTIYAVRWNDDLPFSDKKHQLMVESPFLFFFSLSSLFVSLNLAQALAQQHAVLNKELRTVEEAASNMFATSLVFLLIIFCACLCVFKLTSLNRR